MARILLAEDDAALRLLYAIWLGHGGDDVRTVNDGRAAVALVEAGWVPDVAVLDVQMPLVDGIAVCRYLHARDERVHIVVVSAFEDVREAAVHAGAAEFFEKPIDRDRLLSAIRRPATALRFRAGLQAAAAPAARSA